MAAGDIVLVDYRPDNEYPGGTAPATSFTVSFSGLTLNTHYWPNDLFVLEIFADDPSVTFTVSDPRWSHAFTFASGTEGQIDTWVTNVATALTDFTVTASASCRFYTWFHWWTTETDHDQALELGANPATAEGIGTSIDVPTISGGAGKTAFHWTAMQPDNTTASPNLINAPGNMTAFANEEGPGGGGGHVYLQTRSAYVDASTAASFDPSASTGNDSTHWIAQGFVVTLAGSYVGMLGAPL